MRPLYRTAGIAPEARADDRLPPDRYGQMQKRSYGALMIRGRTVRNDWSRVALLVMLDAARDAGVVFTQSDVSTDLPAPLAPSVQKRAIWENSSGTAVHHNPSARKNWM